MCSLRAGISARTLSHAISRLAPKQRWMSRARIRLISRQGTSGYCSLNASGRFFAASPRILRFRMTASRVFGRRTLRRSCPPYGRECGRSTRRYRRSRMSDRSGTRDLADHTLAQEGIEGVGCDRVDGGSRVVGEEAFPFHEGKNPTGRENSTRTSMSLVSFCSPRETDPKIPIRLP